MADASGQDTHPKTRQTYSQRAPIDRPEWRYEVEKLKDQGPFAIAYHVAALAHLEHSDEERAREILEEVEAERG